MQRRDFIQLSGLGIGGLLTASIPVLGNAVSPEYLLEASGRGVGIDNAAKKRLADIALNAAKSKGATYTDVRIGRYLQQFVFTREAKVQNIANAESFGVGIRVIANGTWGFAATSDVTPRGHCQMRRNRRSHCQSQRQTYKLNPCNWPRKRVLAR